MKTLRMIVVVASVLLAGRAAAQSVPVQGACDPGLDAALRASLASRGAPARESGDVAVSLDQRGATCIATLVSGEVMVELGAVSDAASADDVASRAAFLVASGWPGPQAPEPAPEPEPEVVVVAAQEPLPPAEPAPFFPNGRPDTWSDGYARTPFVAVLTPRLAWPVPDAEPTVATFSFDLIGAGTDAIDGAQLTLIGSTTRDFVRGAQIGGLWTAVRGPLAGVQLGSFVSWAGGPVAGAQLGSVNIARGEVRGAQFGMVNIAPDVWVQYGSVNVSSGRARVQVGMVNVARDADVALGVVSVVREQPVYGYAAYNERNMLTVGLRHGSRIVQNLYEVGYHLTGERVLSLGYGLGVTATPGAALIQVDAVSSVLLRLEDTVTRYVGTTGELRLSGGFHIGRFAAYAGPTYTLYYTQDSDYDVPPGWAYRFDVTPPDRLYGWPGFRAGVRF